MHLWQIQYNLLSFTYRLILNRVIIVGTKMEIKNCSWRAHGLEIDAASENNNERAGVGIGLIPDHRVDTEEECVTSTKGWECWSRRWHPRENRSELREESGECFKQRCLPHISNSNTVPPKLSIWPCYHHYHPLSVSSPIPDAMAPSESQAPGVGGDPQLLFFSTPQIYSIAKWFITPS